MDLPHRIIHLGGQGQELLVVVIDQLHHRSARRGAVSFHTIFNRSLRQDREKIVDLVGF